MERVQGHGRHRRAGGQGRAGRGQRVDARPANDEGWARVIPAVFIAVLLLMSTTTTRAGSAASTLA